MKVAIVIIVTILLIFGCSVDQTYIDPNLNGSSMKEMPKVQEKEPSGVESSQKNPSNIRPLQPSTSGFEQEKESQFDQKESIERVVKENPKSGIPKKIIVLSESVRILCNKSIKDANILLDIVQAGWKEGDISLYEIDFYWKTVTDIKVKVAEIHQDNNAMKIALHEQVDGIANMINISEKYHSDWFNSARKTLAYYIHTKAKATLAQKDENKQIELKIRSDCLKYAEHHYNITITSFREGSPYLATMSDVKKALKILTEAKIFLALLENDQRKYIQAMEEYVSYLEKVIKTEEIKIYSVPLLCEFYEIQAAIALAKNDILALSKAFSHRIIHTEEYYELTRVFPYLGITFIKRADSISMRTAAKSAWAKYKNDTVALQAALKEQADDCAELSRNINIMYSEGGVSIIDFLTALCLYDMAELQTIF
jgi:hypothetical protein